MQDLNLFSHTLYMWVVLQVLSGLASLTDSELDGRQGDKRPQETAAANASIRKDALSCCLQVRGSGQCVIGRVLWLRGIMPPTLLAWEARAAAVRPPAT